MGVKKIVSKMDRKKSHDKAPKAGTAESAEAAASEVSGSNSDLRGRAEEMLLKEHGEFDKIPPAEMQSVVHELRVHQIELEMQNEELRRTQQELEASREKYFDLYDLAPAAYVSLNEKGIILEANLSAAELFGIERSHLLGKPLTRFIHGEDQDIYYLCHKHLLVTRVPTMCEIRMVRKNGIPFWVRIDLAWHGIEGANGFRAVIIDMSQRKPSDDDIENLIRLLKRQVTQLELSTEELDAFSSSVSHDLRAPLRHISGYADLLQKKLKNQLHEKGMEYSSLISRAAKEMKRLIEDLLSYSSLAHEKMQKREVNLSQLLEESIRKISKETKERDIVWTFGEVPNVYGEPSMLKLVIANLISNAIKFTSTRSRAEIEMGCGEDRNEYVCFIKDNGVGFNMDHVDRLFGIFQRVHPQEEFEGAGIGLATVRRIVSLHGGRTWAEGVVDQGATFYFTLPKPLEFIK